MKDYVEEVGGNIRSLQLQCKKKKKKDYRSFFSFIVLFFFFVDMEVMRV